LSNYEILLILNPGLGEAAVNEKIELFSKWVKELGGNISSVDNRGVERLSFEINKTTQGHFVLVKFDLSADKIDFLRKEIRLEENFWRYMLKKLETVKVSK